MRGLIENRFGLLALVLVAVAALYGVAYVSRPAPVAHAELKPVRAAVESVTTVCPAPSGAKVSVVTPPGATGPGTAALTPLTPDADKNDSKNAGKGGDKSDGKGDGKGGDKSDGKQGEAGSASPAPLDTVSGPGLLWQRRLPVGGGPLTVAATGSMAPGLETAQTTREESGAQRGLAGVRCVEPGADAWFVGPGPAAAEVALYVANADRAPADVSIMIYSGEGPVLSERGNSLILKPGESRVVNLREMAPSPLVMALEVSTGTGRVAAAVRAAFGKGRGVDWLPISTPPATRVVVPGIPGTAGLRELYVAAPGEQDTVVQVKAVLKDGSYALKNKESVEVPAGSTASLDLSTGIGGQPAALVLTADVPIVAGLKVTGTGTSQDVAFTAGAPSIDLGSVVADGRITKKQVSRLVLSAPFEPATVQVRLLPMRGTAPQPVEVRLPAGRTRELKLTPPPGGEAGFGVVVQPEPGSGPVYGGRALDESASDGQMITMQPLEMARTWALVPPTTDAPSAVLPQWRSS
ncbi:hypothetical protein JOL79_19705 [Microbispora sp. RL4-1S]|uniref:Secreted protein n=1 Tax=Microbispora oryzae TaxID=2806554 RepID=A0A940WN21_9ACTN|nr:DUF5719 family protein [Microbispora oryzae]MBP2706038.1 hypothetical protein [Microbispora oryzae]